MRLNEKNSVSAIPQKTLWEIKHPAPEGERHDQAVRVACSLSGCGFANSQIVSQLQEMYSGHLPITELQGIASWADSKSFMSGHTWSSTTNVNVIASHEPFSGTAFSKHVSPSVLIEKSPTPVPDVDHWQDGAALLLRQLYQAEDKVNIVWKYKTIPDTAGETKANPSGYGLTLPVSQWLDKIHSAGVPVDEAGTWIRMNPTDGTGVGDANVVDFRFALIEFDHTPFPQQVGIAEQLLSVLPVAAIITSGGKSLHLWCAINATSQADYRSTVVNLLKSLKPLGVDPSNKNCSRLSRLPGVKRQLGGAEDHKQRLLYLEPAAASVE